MMKTGNYLVSIVKNNIDTQFANTAPANGKNKRGNLCKTGKALKRLPNTHKKKSRFRIRVRGLRNLELIKDAEQCFIFLNGLYEKATSVAGSPSRPVT